MASQDFLTLPELCYWLSLVNTTVNDLQIHLFPFVYKRGPLCLTEKIPPQREFDFKPWVFQHTRGPVQQLLGFGHKCAKNPRGLSVSVGTCVHSATAPKNSALNHVSWGRLSEVQAQSIGPMCMRISQHGKGGQTNQAGLLWMYTKRRDVKGLWLHNLNYWKNRGWNKLWGNLNWSADWKQKIYMYST